MKQCCIEKWLINSNSDLPSQPKIYVQLKKVYLKSPLSEYIQNPWHYSKAWSHSDWTPLASSCEIHHAHSTPIQYIALLRSDDAGQKS